MTARPVGVIAPLVTPADAFGSVSAVGVRRQVAYVRGWVDGLMPAISCGEGWRLTAEQWSTLIAATVEAADGLPVYAGCQALTWASMRARVIEAGNLGVDAVVLSLPIVEADRPDDALLDAFTELAALLRVPAVYYWESFVSRRDVSPTLCARICGILDAVAVKDSMRRPDATVALVAQLAGRVSVLQGWEDLLDADTGVEGYVGPLALLSDAPKSVFALQPRWADIREQTARYRLLESDYVAHVKAELCHRGVIPSAAEFPNR